MKYLIGILLVIVSFFSCSKNDDEITSFEGTFNLTAVNLIAPIDLNNDGIESLNLMDEMSCYDSETLQFRTDGTGQANNTSYPDIYHLGNEVFDIICLSASENFPFDYVKTENNITLNLPVFGNVSGTVLGNTFTYTIFSGFSYTAYNNGVPFTVTIASVVTYVYTKQ